MSQSDSDTGNDYDTLAADIKAMNLTRKSKKSCLKGSSGGAGNSNQEQGYLSHNLSNSDDLEPSPQSGPSRRTSGARRSNSNINYGSVFEEPPLNPPTRNNSDDESYSAYGQLNKSKSMSMNSVRSRLSIGSASSFRTIGGTRRRVDIPIEAHERILPENYIGYKGIFIGNMTHLAEEDEVKRIFSEFGKVMAFKMFRSPRSSCALIRYSNINSPRRAIQKYNGLEVEGVSNFNRHLLVRYAPGDRQPRYVTNGKRNWAFNECYYWRTTGCDIFTRKCCKEHIPICQGIDYQPWMTQVTFYPPGQ